MSARHSYAWLALGLAGFARTAASADALPDTSAWKCEQCPFFQGYEANATAGAFYARGANDSYGRYTGINRSTVYPDVDASGQYRRADGLYVSYDLERLGLASREGFIAAGEEGRYDLRLSYDGQPTRLYDTGVTPFQGIGTSTLGLPSNWVSAGSTAGMTQLKASLAPVELGYDRRTVALLGRLLVSSAWTVFAGFQHQEKDGTDVSSASFLTQALQLPQPINYVTNSVDAGATWAGRWASVRLSYSGSWFEDDTDALTFANPYLPFVPGATLGRLALPPGNGSQQIAAAGTLRLPWWATTLTFNGSFGRLLQNAAFLPVSTLAGSTVPTPGSLDGDVHLSHYAVSIASRPLPRLSVRGSAAYDGRDDGTSPLAIAYVVTDTFPGGTVLTPRYSEDRVRLDGGADYELARWVRLGVGGELSEQHYSPGQVLTWSQDAESWGRATLIPLDSLSLTLKGGDGLRKTSNFNAAALPPGENPLLGAFNYAPRDRVFYSLTGSWSVTPTLTLSLEGFAANDDYRLSQLGLSGSHERRGSTALTWQPRDNLSLHADLGYQRIYTLQHGYAGAALAPWQVANAERFWNAEVGGEWVVRERWTLNVDYLHAPSYTDTSASEGGLAQPFPQDWTRLDTLRFEVTYRRSAALQFHLRYSYENFNSYDWALAGVGPATLSDVLALGLEPYHHSVNLFGLTVSYRFGARPAGAASP